MMARFARPLAVDIRVQRVGDWILRAAGVFAAVMREVAEMTYQWKKPFVLDDTKWRARFGGDVTSLEVGVDETARWALRRFSTKKAA
jgi:hypothetical protein